MLRSLHEKLERARAGGELDDDRVGSPRLRRDHGLRRRALPRRGDRQRARSDLPPVRADRPRRRLDRRQRRDRALVRIRSPLRPAENAGLARPQHCARARVGRAITRSSTRTTDSSPTSSSARLQILDAQPQTDMVFGHVTEFVSPEIDESARRCSESPCTTRRGDAQPDAGSPEAFHRVGPFSETLRSASASTGTPVPSTSGLKEAVPPFLVLERRLHTSNNGIRHARRPAAVPPRAEAVARPQALGRADHAAHRRGLMAARPGLVGSFWPSSQQELLLRARCSTRSGALQAWLLLKPSLDSSGSSGSCPVADALREAQEREHRGVRSTAEGRLSPGLVSNQLGLDAPARSAARCMTPARSSVIERLP